MSGLYLRPHLRHIVSSKNTTSFTLLVLHDSQEYKFVKADQVDKEVDWLHLVTSDYKMVK